MSNWGHSLSVFTEVKLDFKMIIYLSSEWKNLLHSEALLKLLSLKLILSYFYGTLFALSFQIQKVCSELSQLLHFCLAFPQ